ADLSLPGHPKVFAVGDIAAVSDQATGEFVPEVAPAAMQMGKYVGRLIRQELLSGSLTSNRIPFQYRNKGQMATIGRSHAVADIGGFQLGGFLAWLLWGLVHVLFLVSFRNRVGILMQWIWDYITFSKGARLITGQSMPQVKSYHSDFLVPVHDPQNEIQQNKNA
ncbi:MAG: NAD(P)/FAD-dependent oxidoreductase, partial [Isosphaeraceae bacterium]